MNPRRQFLRKMTEFGTAFAVSPFLQSSQGDKLLAAFERTQAQRLAEATTDEDFWNQIQQAYTVSANVINLNNGGVCPQPKVVQEAVEHYNRLSNQAPSYYMWRILDAGREPLRRKLADLLGASPDEIAINRNSSEGLETIIFGLRLRAGDEVVLTKQDYPNMINAYKQREHRDGIKLKWLSFDLPLENDDEIVQTFVNAFTEKTKVVHITHMINWNGQIMPVKKIADAAHERGIEVVVDSAHTFAHLNYSIEDLGCDYWATSLHKWLCAPFGSGMLYVKKEKIANLYPLFAAPDPESDDIRKFENLGTRSFAIEQAIGHAVNFFHMIGAERKEARLHYLKNYWAEKAQEFPGVSIGTSLHRDYGCAIGLLQIEGHDPVDVSSWLFRNYKLHTVGIKWDNINGVRITPNVYTTPRDLDVLVDAIREYPV
ncbi:aminotransferase class V-fold PLP-dependent enzyme [Flavilitoribacter nigricans]|uniref:Aminotransferase n=1 Tax=Flavilitoribacter nigricans (strain ATCC 23147 / DSM 23189 / NBRC 102662 / NCIMB 1420 / SS-2) TaxID=1122177 RepID=A0A2D0MXW5_FLAN2|nr:aminotransferase [Flavilitoribacter nigricans DSM 23189 = NBRC 102662]